eukprot:10667965-Alexandrium_andersonii.AAC.1
MPHLNRACSSWQQRRPGGHQGHLNRAGQAHLSRAGHGTPHRPEQGMAHLTGQSRAWHTSTE